MIADVSTNYKPILFNWVLKLRINYYIETFPISYYENGNGKKVH